MTERIEVDGKNSDDVMGKCGLYTCLKCRKLGYSVQFNTDTVLPPEGWQAIIYTDTTDNYGDTDHRGYLCPECWAEANKPFSYSIEVNGEVVQPPKTITPFKTKDGSAV